MSSESEKHLSELGSGKHEPVTGLFHAELPVISPDQAAISGLKIGQPVENRLIMQYLAPRTESKPIVDTSEIDQQTGMTYSQKLLDSNQ